MAIILTQVQLNTCAAYAYNNTIHTCSQRTKHIYYACYKCLAILITSLLNSVQTAWFTDRGTHH